MLLDLNAEIVEETGVLRSNQGPPWEYLNDDINGNGIELRLVSAKEFEGVTKVYFNTSREEQVTVRKSPIGIMRPYTFRKGMCYELVTHVDLVQFENAIVSVDLNAIGKRCGLLLVDTVVEVGRAIRLVVFPTRNVEIAEMSAVGVLSYRVTERLTIEETTGDPSSLFIGDEGGEAGISTEVEVDDGDGVDHDEDDEENVDGEEETEPEEEENNEEGVL